MPRLGTALRLAGAAAALLLAAPAHAQSDYDYAMQLANPLSNLISVPFQLNYNGNFRPRDGHQYTLNIQPVIPFSISENWNLISRTIVPIVSQDDVAPEFRSQFGLGSTVQNFFFSPKQPTAGGLTWGAGPVFLIPTDTDGLGSNQWGAGVTGVALRQTGPWTLGLLANHIWSITGNDTDGDISRTFLQPFVNYTTPRATSFFLNTEASYDWEGDQWLVPINAGVNQLLSIGGRKVQVGGGLRYWAESPDFGPQGWGARLVMTFLFPRL